MKAEKINVQLEAQKIHSQFGTTEMANYKIQKLCEAYAKDQIQKDRERVEKKSDDYDFIEVVTPRQLHNNTPIILD